MTLIENTVVVIHIILCVFIVLVVLVQGGNSGGVGAAFGGGNSQGFFGATGATSFFGKLTYLAAFLFLITSISLVRLNTQGGETGLSEELEEKLRQTKQEETAPPPEMGDEETPAEPEESAPE